MRQDSARRLENVLFHLDGLQARLNATANQLLSARSSLMVAHEQFEHHCELSSVSHQQLYSLVLSSVSRCFDEIASLKTMTSLIIV